MRNVVGILAAIGVVVGACGGAVAQAEKRTAYYSVRGVAIGGYDPVAYFLDDDAIEGKRQFALNWKGVRWHFVNADHRDRFAADPETYAPQYNGYCAFAASRNYIFRTEPTAWTVYKGKLYLNAGLGTAVRWRWNRDENIRVGDANWTLLRKQLDR